MRAKSPLYYELIKDNYSHTGAPSVDPVVVFKLSLIGYLYNISSERRLIEEAALNHNLSLVY